MFSSKKKKRKTIRPGINAVVNFHLLGTKHFKYVTLGGVVFVTCTCFGNLRQKKFNYHISFTFITFRCRPPVANLTRRRVPLLTYFFTNRSNSETQKICFGHFAFIVVKYCRKNKRVIDWISWYYYGAIKLLCYTSQLLLCAFLYFKQFFPSGYRSLLCTNDPSFFVENEIKGFI